MTHDDIELVQALISKALNARVAPAGRDGVIVGGSYDPNDGTVSVQLGDTQSAFPDYPDAPATLTKISLATGQLGDQYGPVGGERVTVHEAQCGPVALLQHGADDSPGAPAGERWIAHRNAAGAIDAYIKWTNDGPNEGDKLGGLRMLLGAFAQLATAGGLSLTFDDAKGVITLGAGDDPGSSEGLVRQSDLQAALNDIHTKLQTWATASLQPGSGATAPPAFASATSSEKTQSA